MKVGERTLSANTYSETGDRLLTQAEYGNGGKVRYTYDDHKRLSAVTVDDDLSPAYSYAYNAANAVGQVTDHRLNRTLTTQYDTANRPMQNAGAGRRRPPGVARIRRYRAIKRISREILSTAPLAWSTTAATAWASSVKPSARR